MNRRGIIWLIIFLPSCPQRSSIRIFLLIKQTDKPGKIRLLRQNRTRAINTRFIIKSSTSYRSCRSSCSSSSKCTSCTSKIPPQKSATDRSNCSKNPFPLIRTTGRHSHLLSFRRTIKTNISSALSFYKRLSISTPSSKLPPTEIHDISSMKKFLSL